VLLLKGLQHHADHLNMGVADAARLLGSTLVAAAVAPSAGLLLLSLPVGNLQQQQQEQQQQEQQQQQQQQCQGGVLKPTFW
jgi:hypothetical protein